MPLDAPRHAPLTDREVDDGGEGRALRCRGCAGVVTHSHARVAVVEDQLHVFTNPAGVTFHVHTFSSAPGAIATGPASTHWSWFPGCAWRVAQCQQCGAHLGWYFEGGGHFWGLIVDRLRESEDD